jgi:hypothetical protein
MAACATVENPRLNAQILQDLRTWVDNGSDCSQESSKLKRDELLGATKG